MVYLDLFFRNVIMKILKAELNMSDFSISSFWRDPGFSGDL